MKPFQYLNVILSNFQPWTSGQGVLITEYHYTNSAVIWLPPWFKCPRSHERSFGRYPTPKSAGTLLIQCAPSSHLSHDYAVQTCDRLGWFASMQYNCRDKMKELLVRAWLVGLVTDYLLSATNFVANCTTHSFIALVIVDRNFTSWALPSPTGLPHWTPVKGN